MVIRFGVRYACELIKIRSAQSIAKTIVIIKETGFRIILVTIASTPAAPRSGRDLSSFSRMIRKESTQDPAQVPKEHQYLADHLIQLARVDQDGKGKVECLGRE